MKVAVLGWGSLTWDPRTLKVENELWSTDGPTLPIEFARISNRASTVPRLTLVLYEADWVLGVATLWNLSQFDDLDKARTNLAQREGITAANPLDLIGYVRMGSGPVARRSQLTSITNPSTQAAVLTSLDAWLVSNPVDAVIWTDLPYSPDLAGPAATALPTEDDIARWLGDLVKKGTAAAAEEYICRAPAQIRTLVRARAERDLNWWYPKLIASPIRTADDPRFKEWSECRAALGRLDNNLQDIRKYGFTLITGLLSASAFLGLLGTQMFGASTPPLQMRAGVVAVIIFLIAALFSVDRYYEILLSGATERAMDLEAQTNPPLRLTKYLSFNATRTGSTFMSLLLYAILLGIAGSLGALMLARAAEVAEPNRASFAEVVQAAKSEAASYASAVALASAKRDLAAAEAEKSDLPFLQWALAICFYGALFYIARYWFWSRNRMGPKNDKTERVWPERTLGKVAAPMV